MNNDNPDTYYIITAPSSIHLGTCLLGHGATPAEAWEDATGKPKAKRGWYLRETTYEDAMQRVHGG